MTSSGVHSLWMEGSLTDLGMVARGRSRHRPRNDPALFGGRYPFFQTGDVKAAELYLTTYRETYNDAGLAQSRLWPAGTLAITIAANIADAAILGVSGCFPDSVVGFTPHPKKSDVVFVKYLLDYVKRKFENISGGTTQDNLSLSKLLSVSLRYPEIKTQRKIAGVLSAYDDLIANNNRRITILEEMAQRIYKEWFVDFHYPGHGDVPLVDSELGFIPDEWSVRTFEDLGTYVNGFAFKPTDWGSEGPPIVKIRELKNGVTDETPRYQGELSEKYVIRDGDLLFSWSADLDVYLWAGGTAWLNQHLFRVDPLAAIPTTFLFHALKERMGEFRSLSQGTTMRHIKRAALGQVMSVVPPPSLRRQFAELTSPIDGLVRALVRATRNARDARDLLLPRIVAGEIDVADLDIAVPELAA